MSNYISYYDLLKSRDQFRKSGGNSGASEFNYYDTPGHKYFKLFFYFDNEDSDLDGVDNGLLAPTWMRGSVVKEDTYYLFNSAWSYLKMNADDGRAALVEKFVNLLSNISSESPWYFSEISGLDAALERKLTVADSFAIESTRPKISIKCLPDSFDDRIGTLLDLYRAIVWDWSTKREMLPANLRKFDMGILIFETATSAYHVRKLAKPQVSIDGWKSGDYSMVYGASGDLRSSYKYIEFHNCEIDYTSVKSGYSSLNNKDGFSAEYTIDIFYDDCYESRYNDFTVAEFGDIILDIDGWENDNQSKNIKEAESYRDKYFKGNVKQKERKPRTYNAPEIATSWDAHPTDTIAQKLVDQNSEYRLAGYPKDPKFQKGGFLANMVDQLIDTGLDKVNSLLKKAVLGNLYTFSLTRIGNQIKSLAQGNVIGAVRDVQGYINNANVKEKQHFDQSRLSPEPIARALPTISVDHDLFVKPEPNTSTISEDHNLFTNREYYLGTTGGKMFGHPSGYVGLGTADHKIRDMFPNGEYYLGSAEGNMFGEAPTPIEHKVKPIHEKPNIQPGTLSPTFMEPTGYEMGQPSGSLPGEVKPKEQHKQSDMFPRGTQAWTKSNGGEMFEKKKIKPSVKYIGNMFEGSSIANNL